MLLPRDREDQVVLGLGDESQLQQAINVAATQGTCVRLAEGDAPQGNRLIVGKLE